uniref:Segregation/condensation protein A n=1 Tax=Geoglobus ahangari TaxID=113653 RepID=A0A7C4S5T5_9EURY
MIYDLVKRGEINPLNVDVIDVADKFLKEIEKARELDLRIPARVLLYASILIRMKSEIIANEIFEQLKEKDDKEDSEKEYMPEFLIEDVDFNVDFSIARKRARRFTTLEDLIRELRAAEEVQRRRKEKKRKERGEIPTPFEIPHEEDFERVIEIVKEKIFKKLRKKTLKLSEIEEVDLISRYLSVLHLAYRGYIELKQEKIFESEIEIEFVTKI